jgi:hypothetical protein
VRGYLELLRLPGARVAAIPAAFARLALTMAALAVLLAAVEAGYSYTAAGGASAAYAGGYAVAAPLLGRLMDRLGTPVVVRFAGVAAPATLVAVALSVGHVAAITLVAMSLLAGLVTAPVGASMRALWVRLTADPVLLRRAHALEATLSEALFVVGPASVTLFVVALDARAALVATAVLLSGGCFGYARAPAVRAPAGSAEGSAAGSRDSAGSRPTGGLIAVLCGVALTAAMCGALTVALPAALRAQHSAAALTGTLIALQSVASTAGGLVYGARAGDGGAYAHYLRLLLVLIVTLCPLPAAILAYRAGLPAGAALGLLCLLLVLSGVAIAPTGAAEFQLVGEMTAQHRMTQAFAGVGGVIALGDAGGAAVAGYLADRVGPVGTLLLPAACAATALVVTLAARQPILAASTRGSTAVMAS